ncbi:MAG: hypothetical protein AAFR96_12715 [Planctomycetota bacterium]
MNADQIDQVNQFVAALREHGWWANSGLVIALVTGVLLWVSGRRVLRPAFAVIGSLLGGFMGHALVPAIGFDEIVGLPGDVAGAVGGGMLGALGALLVFRLAIGVLASGVLAGLGILAAAVIIQMNPAPPESGAATDASPFVEVRPAEPGSTGSGTDPADGEPNAFDRVIDRGRSSPTEVVADPGTFAKDLFVGLKAETWDPLTAQQRTLLAGGGFLGLLLGLGFSVFFPKKSTAMVTAFAGAGIWLPSVYLLLEALEAPGRGLLERSAVQWTAIWLVVSLTGLLIQTVGLKERKDKRDRRSDGDDWDDEQLDRRRSTRDRRRRRQRDRDDDDDDWD